MEASPLKCHWRLRHLSDDTKGPSVRLKHKKEGRGSTQALGGFTKRTQFPGTAIERGPCDCFNFTVSVVLWRPPIADDATEKLATWAVTTKILERV